MTDKRIYISPTTHSQIKSLADRHGLPLQHLSELLIARGLDLAIRDGIGALYDEVYHDSDR